MVNQEDVRVEQIIEDVCTASIIVKHFCSNDSLHAILSNKIECRDGVDSTLSISVNYLTSMLNPIIRNILVTVIKP